MWYVAIIEIRAICATARSSGDEDDTVKRLFHALGCKLLPKMTELLGHFREYILLIAYDLLSIDATGPYVDM